MFRLEFCFEAQIQGFINLIFLLSSYSDSPEKYFVSHVQRTLPVALSLLCSMMNIGAMFRAYRKKI